MTDTERITNQVLDAWEPAPQWAKTAKAEDQSKERTQIGNTPAGADDGQQAEELFSKVQQLQTDLWNALHELEDLTGLEIDSTMDLSSWTLDRLIASADADDE